MNNKYYHTEIIESYLKGTMNADEKAAFEKALTEDEFLKDAIAGFQQSGALPEDVEIISMPSKVKPTLKRLTKVLLYSGIAAAVVAVFIIIHVLSGKAVPPKNTNHGNELANNTGETRFVIPVVDTVAPWVEAETIYTGEMLQLPKESSHSESIEPLFVNKSMVIQQTTKEPDIVDLYRFRSNHPYTYICGLKVVDYRFEIRRQPNSNNIPANKVQADYLNPIEFAGADATYTYVAFLEQSLGFYKQGRYQEAIENFIIIEEHFPGDLNAIFYKAMCYYNLNNNKKSIESFTALLNADINTFIEESMWYSSLIYKEEKQYAAAEKVLEEIVKENGYYGAQAQKELDALYDEYLDGK
ncbi:MAG: hypothetical protein KBB11_09020 [Bacteroidales bacterium]|nr:hypothetical protein [Bacteroidales bacterium]HOY38128.1 hypothetical protein [Bacteroidales bacterium]HQP03748.1 hypothetical protein [Bacteroidales bacterium]